MKKLRTQLTYTAFFLTVCTLAWGCASMFEPAPKSATSPTNAVNQVQPATGLVDTIKTTGSFFPPYGPLAAAAAVLALQVAANIKNKRDTASALEDHLDEYHSTPPNVPPRPAA